MAFRTITIKRLPDTLYRRLKGIATEHRRSLNSEVIECLERSVGSRRVDAHELLTSIDALRQRLALPPATDKSLRQSKSSGRP